MIWASVTFLVGDTSSLFRLITIPQGRGAVHTSSHSFVEMMAQMGINSVSGVFLYFFSSFSIFSLQWQWALTLKHVFATRLFFLCHRNTGVLWITPVISIQNNVSKYRQDMYAHIVFIYSCINNIFIYTHIVTHLHQRQYAFTVGRRFG